MFKKTNPLKKSERISKIKLFFKPNYGTRNISKFVTVGAPAANDLGASV